MQNKEKQCKKGDNKFTKPKKELEQGLKKRQNVMKRRLTLCKDSLIS